MRKVQSLLDARISYDGKTSGQHYEWDRAGSIVEVQDDDVSDLLSKRLGSRLCCGDNISDGNKIFAIFEEQ